MCAVWIYIYICVGSPLHQARKGSVALLQTKRLSILH